MNKKDSTIVNINIAKEFSTTPGPRYEWQGEFSGELFRDKFLIKYFSDPNDETILAIDIDGVDGYPPSFLEETFGGLVRKFGRSRVNKKIILIAEKLKFFKEQAEKFIVDAEEFTEK